MGRILGSHAKASKKKRIFNTEILITSMIDIFTVLLVFLLYSAVFIKLAVINVALPGLGAGDAAKSKKGEKTIQLAVGITKEKLIIGVSGSENYEREITVDPSNNFINEFHNLLVSIKQKYPTKTDMIVMPDKDVNYEYLVLVLDYSRDIYSTDPEIIGTDELGNQMRLTNLFPDVILAGT